jgi:hypothetical protein
VGVLEGLDAGSEVATEGRGKDRDTVNGICQLWRDKEERENAYLEKAKSTLDCSTKSKAAFSARALEAAVEGVELERRGWKGERERTVDLASSFGRHVGGLVVLQERAWETCYRRS